MFEELVSYLAYGSLLLGLASAYLSLNKLWSRKHIPDVAASISIPGVILEIIPTFIFGLYYFINLEPIGVIDSAIWVTVAVVYMLVGSGFWVQGQRRAGLLQLAWRSVLSERSELSNLARSILHPGSSRPLVDLLQRFAEVDGEVSEAEVRLIRDVADRMNVDIKLEPRSVGGGGAKNVEKLVYLMRRLNLADGIEHEDERHAIDELQGSVNNYLAGENEAPA